MKLKTLLSFFYLLFLFGSTYATETEPNDTRAQANTLTLNGSNSGAINPAGDVDWFKVTTNADGMINITFTSDGNNVTAVLYDNDGVTVITSGTTAGSTTISADGLAVGTYYIEVSGYYNNQTLNYTISNTLTPAAVAIDTEPDSTRAQANVLALNDSTTGHIGYYYNNHRDSVDWYKVTTNSDGLLRLTLTSGNGRNVSAYLFDNNGATQLHSITTSGTNLLSTDGLAAGTYYIEIVSYYNNQFEPYKLADSLFTPALANDSESDSTIAQAHVLVLNDSTTGHINYYYNNHRDSVDWYKVTTNADGLLRLTLTSGNGSNVSAYLFDNNGATPLNSITTNGTNLVSTDGLATGTYYIEIVSYYNNQFEPYMLADSLFTYNLNDSIPNQYALQAPTISANRTQKGHINFYYNLQRDSTDWYKINYTGSGNLDFYFNLLPNISTGNISNVTFYVYSDTAAAPSFTFTTARASNIFNLSSLTQGYYYIKMTSYYNTQFEAYSLTDSFTQVNKATVSLAKAASSDTNCNSDSLTFNLGASHAPYTVRLYRDGILTDSVITNSSTAAFTGLNDGNYYATVYGDGATDSAYGKTGNTQFLPTTPSDLSASDINAHGATLNISMLSCVEYYVVQYKVTGTNTYTTINTAVNMNGMFVLTGLDPSTMYTYRIASTDLTNGLVSPYSDTATFMTLSVLPVTFLNFDGVLQDGKALLSWSTATELNNKGFGVERSYDGQNFTTIGLVQGHENSSSVNNYKYTDEKVLSGYNYYRLKQSDIDGDFNYSSIIRLDFQNFNWTVFGNPVTKNTWIQLQLVKTSDVTIQVLTIDGKIIKAINKGLITQGTYSIPLNVGNVSAGVYIVKLIIDNHVYLKKIIK